MTRGVLQECGCFYFLRYWEVFGRFGCMRDGLYQVATKYFCAGFVIQGGKAVWYAPILKNKFAYWVTVAKRISD